MEIIKCPHCGKDVLSNADTCFHCGNKIIVTETKPKRPAYPGTNFAQSPASSPIETIEPIEETQPEPQKPAQFDDSLVNTVATWRKSSGKAKFLMSSGITGTLMLLILLPVFAIIVGLIVFAVKHSSNDPSALEVLSLMEKYVIPFFMYLTIAGLINSLYLTCQKIFAFKDLSAYCKANEIDYVAQLKSALSFDPNRLLPAEKVKLAQSVYFARCALAHDMENNSNTFRTVKLVIQLILKFIFMICFVYFLMLGLKEFVETMVVVENLNLRDLPIELIEQCLTHLAIGVGAIIVYAIISIIIAISCSSKKKIEVVYFTNTIKEEYRNFVLLPKIRY